MRLNGPNDLSKATLLPVHVFYCENVSVPEVNLWHHVYALQAEDTEAPGRHWEHPIQMPEVGTGRGGHVL